MKQVYAAAERNKEPILRALSAVLDRHFGAERPLQLLELASGTGQHAAHLASALPRLALTPSEASPALLPSLLAYAKEGPPNLRPPLLIDVSQPPTAWPPLPSPLHGMLCVNMLHISPWHCTLGLFAAAGHLLSPGGVLVTYGPYAVDGVVSPESNARFHQSLQSQDARWGLRDTRELRREAGRCGLDLAETIPMPANNHTLVFVRRAEA